MYYFDTPESLAPLTASYREIGSRSSSPNSRGGTRVGEVVSPALSNTMYDYEDGGSIEAGSSDSSRTQDRDPEGNTADVLDSRTTDSISLSDGGVPLSSGENEEGDYEDFWRSALSVAVATVVGQNQKPETPPEAAPSSDEQARRTVPTSPRDRVAFGVPVARPAERYSFPATIKRSASDWTQPRSLTPTTHSRRNSPSGVYRLPTDGSLTPFSPTSWTLRWERVPASNAVHTQGDSSPASRASSVTGGVSQQTRSTTLRSTPGATRPSPNRLHTFPYLGEDADADKRSSTPTVLAAAVSRTSASAGLSENTSTSREGSLRSSLLAPAAPSSPSPGSILGETDSPVHTLTTEYRHIAYLIASSNMRRVEMTITPPHPPVDAPTPVPTTVLVPRPPSPSHSSRSAAQAAPSTAGGAMTSPRLHGAHTVHTQPNMKPHPIHASRSRVVGLSVSNEVDLELSLSRSIERCDELSSRFPRSPRLLSPDWTAAAWRASTSLSKTPTRVVPPTSSILLSPPGEKPLPPSGPTTEQAVGRDRGIVQVALVMPPLTPPDTPSSPLLVPPLSRTSRFFRYDTSSYAQKNQSDSGVGCTSSAVVLADIDNEDAYRAVLASLPEACTRFMPDPDALPAGAPYPAALLQTSGLRNARTTFFLPGVPVQRLTRRRNASSVQDSTDGDSTGETPGLPVIAVRRHQLAQPLTAEQLGWKQPGRKDPKETGARQGHVSFADATPSPSSKRVSV